MATRATRNCFYHGDRNSVTGCFMCHKPLCAECRKTIGKADFCSEACASRYASFASRYVPRGRARGTTGHGAVLKLIILIIIGIGVFLAISKVLATRNISLIKEIDKGIHKFLRLGEAD